MLKSLLPGHELPINDLLCLCKWGKIHLRMHAGNLSHGIFKLSAISIGGIVGELFLRLFEEFNLLGWLPLQLEKLDLMPSGPFLQFGHLGLCLLNLLLQINHLVVER